MTKKSSDRVTMAAVFKCRMCWQVAIAVFAAVFFIEGAILIPSVRNVERTQLDMLGREGLAIVKTVFRLIPEGAPASRVLTAAERQIAGSNLVGGSLFDVAGKLIGRFGEIPESQIENARGNRSTMNMRKVAGGDRYEIEWHGDAIGAPFIFLARLDASAVDKEIAAFILRISGLVILIAFFVTGVAMIILGRTILAPVLRLRANLVAAGGDPDNPHLYALGSTRKDELGDVFEAFNRMTRRLSSNLNAMKQHEIELNQAKELAEQASEAKSSFLANMSHELRTPLNAIIGFSSAISGEMFGPVDNAKYLEYAADINTSGVLLLGHINEVLDLSKTAAGKLVLTNDTVEVADAVHACARMVEERQVPGGLSVIVEVPSDLPSMCVDERRFKQVLLNLLSNAVKFTDADGKVVISASVDATGEMKISVADTGIGIAKEDLPKVLTEFARVETRETRNVEGTGLGLPLAKRLVELHGGRLEIESELGLGTTAAIYFPAERVIARAA